MVSLRPDIFGIGCDLFICLCATIHLNSMTPKSSKCEMVTWWIVGVSAATDLFYGRHTGWDDVMINIAFVLLTFEATRSHFTIPRFCKFKDRRINSDQLQKDL